MNKIGHLKVTEWIAESVGIEYKFWLKLGSILPDILVHTYVTGHTWTASFHKTGLRITKLQQHGKKNRYSYLKLGYLIHYIEDYFTFPHNNWFTGNLAEHVQFETELTEHLFSLNNPGNDIKSTNHPMPAEQLISFLEELHLQYQQEQPDFDNDIKYILEAAHCVIYSFVVEFQENQERNRNVYVYFGNELFGRRVEKKLTM